MLDVITFGSATRDTFFYSKNFKVIENEEFMSSRALCFNLGSKIEIDKVVFTTGGGATNVACGFSRLSLKTAAVCQVGKDVAGRAILEELEKEKVKTNFVTVNENCNTAYSIILSLLGRERTILVYRGASENIQPSEIKWPKLKAKWFYITSLGGDFLLLQEILSYAKKNKIKIAINPGAKELEKPYDIFPLLKTADFLLLNQEEAAKLTGIPFEKREEIAEKLKEEIKGIATITCGKEGSFGVFENKIYQAGILPVEAIELAGAGDAFGAGFLAGIIFKNDVTYALQLGTANAASVIQQIGAKKGLLAKKDLEDFRKADVKRL
jgi:sugar/nucleoside kinase (ribokinase family)